MAWITVKAMARVQIQLSERQASESRVFARSRGLSVAEVVRRFVGRGLASESHDIAAGYERAARVIGRWRDRGGRTDVAENHDDYLDEANS
ncbi:MAG: hypothetical protein ACTHJX_08075 [Terriglobales bacterium]